jgi:two-component system, LuxR family, sensor kinase FixL
VRTIKFSINWRCIIIFHVAGLKQQFVEKLETYKDLFDNAHDLIHIVEPDGQIVYVNNSWRNVLGYSDAEIEGRSIYSFIIESDRERYIHYRSGIVNGADNDYEVAFGMVKKDGQTIHVEGFTSAKIVDGNALYTRGIFRDITSRLEHEKKLKTVLSQLQEREANVQQLLFQAPDAIIVVDAQSRIRYWNPKAEVVFGWTAPNVLGKKLTDVIIPPQYRVAHDEGMKRYLETGEQRVLNRTIEITALNSQGKEFYVALTISATVQNGETAFIAFVRDIDEQKRNVSELEQKRIQLEHSNEQLEQFAHVASHDMKEPIRKILMFSDRLQSDKDNILSPQSKKFLAKIENAATRLTEMVEGVLAYSALKGEKLVVESLNLNDIIKNIENDLELPIQQKKAQVIYSRLPTLEGAPFLIYQLFYNLFNNSLKFIKPHVPPVIEISASSVSPERLKDYGLNPKIPHHQIDFKDNGIGFPQEYAATIFKTFSRLHAKEQYEGTGLGLSLCQTIVEKHNGVIEGYGKEDVGATFRIILPEIQP